MLPTTIGSYGGPFADARAVQNPQSEQSAALGNRVFEDVAQATRTALRAIVSFPTDTSSNPAVSAHTSVWGSGDSQKPAVTRTGTGLYTVTYATSFADSLSVTETVAFLFGHASLAGTTKGDVQINTIAANVITVRVYDNAETLSDLGGGKTVTVWLR